MKTLVTGATGFIGNVLVRELEKRGRSVKVLVRSEPQGLEGLNAEIVEGDIRDANSLKNALVGVESVFHFASLISLGGIPKNSLVEKTNVKGAENMAVAALESGVKKFIHCSSIHAFHIGNGNLQINEESDRVTVGSSTYDRSKNEGEKVVRDVIKLGLPGVIINPTGVIGPGDHRPSRMGNLFLNLATRKIPALIPGGFDWVDVRDVCNGAINAESYGKIGENYILSGSWCSTRELADLVEEVTGVKAPKFVIPFWLSKCLGSLGDIWQKLSAKDCFINSDIIDALSSSSKISSAKSKRELNYEPRQIKESMKDTYEWFINNGFLDLKSVKQIGD